MDEIKFSITTLALCLLLTIIAACTAPTEADFTGALATDDGTAYAVMTSTGITLDGATPINFTGSYTRNVDVSGSTELSIWIDCRGNITTLRYETSPDNLLWRNGTSTLATCTNNLSVYEPAEKGVNYLRFFIQSSPIANESLFNTSNVTIVVSRK